MPWFDDDLVGFPGMLRIGDKSEGNAVFGMIAHEPTTWDF